MKPVEVPSPDFNGTFFAAPSFTKMEGNLLKSFV
jgi:hypothetical protein